MSLFLTVLQGFLGMRDALTQIVIMVLLQATTSQLCAGNDIPYSAMLRCSQMTVKDFERSESIFTFMSLLFY